MLLESKVILIFSSKEICFVLSIQDDLESLPFPNDEAEFNLPDEIFESNTKPQSSASESSAVADEGIIVIHYYFTNLSCNNNNNNNNNNYYYYYCYY